MKICFLPCHTHILPFLPALLHLPSFPLKLSSSYYPTYVPPTSTPSYLLPPPTLPSSPPPPLTFLTVQDALAQAGRLPLCEGGPLDDKEQEGMLAGARPPEVVSFSGLTRSTF